MYAGHAAGKPIVRPYIPLLQEHNERKGFFEPQQAASVQRHLPEHMRGIAAFAFETGWRTPSEILPLEWRQVDLKQGEVRLDVGATKNGEGRVFPITIELRRILDVQQQIAETVKREYGTIPRHVFCYMRSAKAGQGVTEGGYNKAWRKARIAAGCPGRIPHDFRRTAVRNLVRAGIPERVAMQMTGHKTLHKTRSVFERSTSSALGTCETQRDGWIRSRQATRPEAVSGRPASARRMDGLADPRPTLNFSRERAAPIAQPSERPRRRRVLRRFTHLSGEILLSTRSHHTCG